MHATYPASSEDIQFFVNIANRIGGLNIGVRSDIWNHINYLAE